MRLAEEGSALLLARNRTHLGGLRDELRYRGEPFTDRTSNAGIPAPESPRGKALRAAFALQAGDRVVGRIELRTLRSQVWAELWPDDTIPRSPMVRLIGLMDMGATTQLVQRLHQDPLSAIRMSRQDREYLAAVIRQHGPKVLERKARIELS